jgi:hypothetical protein
MTLHKGHFRAGRNGIIAVLLPIVTMLAVPLWAIAQEAFPPQIKDVKMGSSMSSVTSMIKGRGSHEEKPLPMPQRKALVWTPQVSRYYNQIQFHFTEKDRLFLIRFNLKNISFQDLRALKKDLFEKYGISWDAPWSLQIKDNDVLLYGPPEQGRVYVFELSNPKTGEKSIELLDKVISKEDRPHAPVVKAKEEEGGPKTEEPGPGSGELESKKPAGEGSQLPPTEPAQKAAGTMGTSQRQEESSSQPK